MSLHYEWTFSLRLCPDVPDAFVEKLRYHFGLSSLVPQAPALDYPAPALAADGEEDELAGGPVVRLVRQRHASRPAAWGVFARAFVVDDAMYELMQLVPPWLARWSRELPCLR